MGLLGWVLVSLAPGWIGSQYLPGAWYASLAKPAWTPPAWIFAPVWTALYVVMGVAAWLVWRRRGIAGAGVALGLFVVQLILNGLWSYLFFGLHRIDVALVEIVALGVTILMVTVLFWRVDWRAGALMIPYLAWVVFASGLTVELWRLNRGPAG